MFVAPVEYASSLLNRKEAEADWKDHTGDHTTTHMETYLNLWMAELKSNPQTVGKLAPNIAK